MGLKPIFLDDQIETTIDTVIVDDLSQINSSNSFHEVYFFFKQAIEKKWTIILLIRLIGVFILLPGYFNSYQDYPAMSDDENTWPSSGWPSVGQQTQWQGYWDGRFGKSVTYADLGETYFVINDAMDQEYIDRNDFRCYLDQVKKFNKMHRFYQEKIGVV